MNILHIVNSLELSEGGTTEALVQLCEVALGGGHQVTVWCAATEGPDARRRLEANGVMVVPFQSILGNRYLSPSMLMASAQETDGFDVIHGHGLWQGATLAALIAARPVVGRGKRPRLVISPHGQLDDWSFAQRTWKKAPYLFGFRKMGNAVPMVWHATCSSEASAIVRRGLLAPAKVVPLSVSEAARPHSPRGGGRLRVLFLGRLHPKKHAGTVIESCAELAAAGQLERLWLVGDGEDRYVQGLHKLAERGGVRALSEFCGVLYGDAKAQALAEADVLVLPSAAENFGLVVAEAAAAALPVVVSDQVGVHTEITAYGAGLVIPPGNVAALAAALRRMLDPELRAQMSAAAAKLAAERYTQASTADALSELYRGTCTSAR